MRFLEMSYHNRLHALMFWYKQKQFAGSDKGTIMPVLSSPAMMAPKNHTQQVTLA